MTQRRPDGGGIVPRDPLVPLTDEMLALLRETYSDEYVQVIGVALRLALDLDTCRMLLKRRPVDPARIDQAELVKAKQKSLVWLVAPIDLLLDPGAAA